MPVRLSQEEVVTIKVLSEKGENHCAVARRMGCTEGTVRYHLRREAEQAEDGRQQRSFKAEAQAEVIRHWMQQHEDRRRPVNVRQLHEHLAESYGYEGSYRSVLRYVRRHWGKPKIRTWRRVETPPGAQTQTDWGEYPGILVGGRRTDLSAFVMALSHSRRPAVVWSEGKDQLAWLHCHNESYLRLAGVAAVNRIDNVKTALKTGAGAWGEIHPVYRAYARAVGFHIDACRPRQAQEKGKVEAKVKLSRLLLDPGGRVWSSLSELQEWTDERLDRWCRRALCPATGCSVYESWQKELLHLAPLPILPEPFDVAVTRPVHRDCMVAFEERRYSVPFRLAGSRVEVRGCSGSVQILAQGRVVRSYPRHTAERLVIDPSCWDGEATDTVAPPPPLGRMGSKIQQLWEMPVEQRPMDLYAHLAEVAR